ncbi:MAG TPA: hypothetical protein VFY23_12195 [Candidatus Limnocylindrales bacterium]|nr:hypothetical protein [Candidatus Limnocylindrales bacterium]
MPDWVLTAAIATTLWASIANIGLVSTPGSFAVTSARRRAVARLGVLNLLAMPLVAALLVAAFGVPPAFATGFLLVAAAAGGPLSITAARIAGGDAHLTVILVVLAAALDAVVIPVWSALLLARDVPVPVLDIVRLVLAWIGLPLALGMVVRAARPTLAERLRRPTALIASVGVPVVIVLAVLANVELAAVPGAWSVVPASVSFVVLGLAAGWLIAGGDRATRIAGSLVTAQRASTLALGIAITSFGDLGEAAFAVVVFGVLTTVVVPSIAIAMRGMRLAVPVSSAAASPVPAAPAPPEHGA